MKKILVEGFDYQDLVNQVEPIVQVDEYSAKMGDDDEIVTLSFVVNGEQVGLDMVDWFERGYEFIMDADVSEGEYKPGKYLVFVEMNRRTTVPEKICELIDDLETLTDIPREKWKVQVKDKDYAAEVDVLKSVIILSPHQYRKINDKEEDLNEMRNLSGLNTKNIFGQPDELLRDFISKAGL
jgi:hypothetical protein